MALKIGTGKIKIVQRDRLRDQIYDFVRGEMRRGLLAPGERLKEVVLAARVGASRTPVREALLQLARDGLLEERNQGYQLPKHSAQELRDRLEIRVLLEPSIARHAALEANAGQQAKLRAALDAEIRLVDSDDARRFLIANLKFKHALLDICRNKLLVNAARLYDDQFQYYRLKTFMLREARQTTVSRHEELVAAIAARDGDGAARALRALLDTATEFQMAHSGVEATVVPLEPRAAAAIPKR